MAMPLPCPVAPDISSPLRPVAWLRVHTPRSFRENGRFKDMHDLRKRDLHEACLLQPPIKLFASLTHLTPTGQAVCFFPPPLPTHAGDNVLLARLRHATLCAHLSPWFLAAKQQTLIWSSADKCTTFFFSPNQISKQRWVASVHNRSTTCLIYLFTLIHSIFSSSLLPPPRGSVQ